MDTLPTPCVDSPELYALPSAGHQNIGQPTLQIVTQASAALSAMPLFLPTSEELESAKSRAGLYRPATCAQPVCPEAGQPQSVAGPVVRPLLPVRLPATLGKML